jgi:hypothetical protein
MWLALSAPKARRILAQRNALGLKELSMRALNGREESSRPFRARLFLTCLSRRVAPG